MKNRYHILPESMPMDNPDTFLDFDQVLQGVAEAKAPNKSFQGYLLAIGIITLLLSAWWGLDQFSNTESNQPPTPKPEPALPVIPEQDESMEDHQTLPQSDTESREITNEEYEGKIVEPQIPDDEHSKDESVEAEQPAARVKPEKQAEMAYVKAVPTEGIGMLYKYFHDELIYPAGDTLSGIMVSTFTITESGEITDIEIENSLGEAFDEEVIRLLTNMPQWEPATVNGTPVESKISIPFTFNAP